MFSHAKRIAYRLLPSVILPPQGESGVHALGHRKYVGGLWDEIGELQYNFLIGRGLLPEHYLIDVACGSLRLGVKAIPYLDSGHYLGIEKEQALLDAGVEMELGRETCLQKCPVLLQSAGFEFEKFGMKGNYAIAQSLFTHLTPELVERCFARLFPALVPGGKFYATYNLNDGSYRNPAKPHDHACFSYTEARICAFGASAGFRSSYLGGWGHPRMQVICEYVRPLEL